MDSQRRADDTVAPEDGSNGHTDSSNGDSAFDVGTELLNAALDEVRKAEPLPPPDPDEPEEPATTVVRRHVRRRVHADARVEPEVAPAPDSEDSDDGADALDAEPRPRRRRRPPTDAAAVPPIEALDSEPRPRRRRRPPSDAPAEQTIEALDSEPRPKGRQRPPTDDATLPALTLPVEAPMEESESPRSPREAAAKHASKPSGGTRRRGRVLALVTALVVAATGVVILATGSDDGAPDRPTPSAGAGAPEQARLAFAPVTTPEGMTVAREWVLRGEDGTSFVGKLSFSNPTSAPLTISHIEVIPKSLAASVDQITFDRQPVVLQADPVVQYAVTAGVGEVVTARYDITVPADGVRRGRLEAWADDLEAGATTTTTTTAPPTTTTSTPPASGSSGGRQGTGGSTPPPPAPEPPSPANGTITIRTISVGGTGTFGYGGVSVTTGGAPDGVGQSGAMTVAPGIYSWTQTSLPPGWHLSNIDCSDRDAGPFEHRSTVGGATANFNVQPGENVVCTWTNRT